MFCVKIYVITWNPGWDTELGNSGIIVLHFQLESKWAQSRQVIVVDSNDFFQRQSLITFHLFNFTVSFKERLLD